MEVLPSKCRRYLNEHGFNFEEVEENGNKGIILRKYSLPLGKFDTDLADILIILPGGYPDNAPDMFYVQPWLRLVPANGYPKAADQPFMFRGNNWQRWSRHNSIWRPGIDGIWVMIKRAQLALEEAA